jgi:hypothetical protein
MKCWEFTRLRVYVCMCACMYACTMCIQTLFVYMYACMHAQYVCRLVLYAFLYNFADWSQCVAIGHLKFSHITLALLNYFKLMQWFWTLTWALIFKLSSRWSVLCSSSSVFLLLYYFCESFHFSSFQYQANVVLMQNLCNVGYSYQHIKYCYNLRISNFEFVTVYIFHSYSTQLLLLYV